MGLLYYLGLFMIFGLYTTQDKESSEESIIKIGTCMNITRARMNHEYESGFEQAIDWMFLASGGSKEEKSKQLLSFAVLLCYKNIDIDYANALRYKLVEEIDALTKVNMELIQLERIIKIYKDKDKEGLTQLFDELKEIKLMLGIEPQEEQPVKQEEQLQNNKTTSINTSQDNDLYNLKIFGYDIKGKFGKVISYMLLLSLVVIILVLLKYIKKDNKDKKKRKLKVN